MLRRPVARLLSIVSLCLVCSSAGAQTVLFACSENCPISLFEALELELRGHGAFLVARLSPSGFSIDAHEADALRMAMLVPAAAVVWVEREPPLRVRVFAPREGLVREAPLAWPPEQIEARTFAAIAGNVVLQAIGAPGHADAAHNIAVASSGPAMPAPSPPAVANPMTPISAEDSASFAQPKAEVRGQRFFLRAGAALGFAYLKSGLPTDRAPPQQLVDEALSAQQAANSTVAGRAYLAAHGYDCNWEMQGASFVASNCNAAIRAHGFQFAPGIDLQAGGYVTPRLALAAVLRIAPDAGYGSFNHALLGAQLEYALIAPKPTGFWTNLGLGFAFGHLQVQPSSDHNQGPYVSAGPYEVHALVALGYKFARHFGVYASTTLRLLFPGQLWMIEPTMGVEVRL
jgi:hypothetical protein